MAVRFAGARRWLLSGRGFAVGIACLVLAMSGPALAQAPPGGIKRLALIIANANYSGAGAPIESAAKDADLLAVELLRDGFTIDRKTDATDRVLRTTVDAFLAKITPGTAAFVYFNGIGLQVGHQTYLLPVDAKIASEADVKSKGINLKAFVDSVHQHGAIVQVAIIDAARPIPKDSRFHPVTDGLATVDAPPGGLVVYAAAPNRLEPERSGDVSIFMSELLKALREPSVSAEEAATQTRIFVSRATNGEQVPYVASTLVDPIYFSRGAPPSAPSAATVPPAQTAAAPPAAPAADDAENAYWKAVALNTVEAYQSVLDRFPNHPRRDAIQTAIRKLADVQAEEKLWQEASTKTGDAAVAPLKHYVEAYPYGVHADDARRRLSQYPDTSSSEPAGQAAKEDYCVAGLQQAGPNNFLVLREQPVLDPNGGWDPDIKLYNGQHLTVLSESGRFYRVRLPSGKEGYSSRDKIVPCGSDEGRSAQTQAQSEAGACAVAGLSDNAPDNWLALRNSPRRSAYFPPDIKLRNGTSLTVLDRRRDWFHVRTPAGEVGWVSARYIRC